MSEQNYHGRPLWFDLMAEDQAGAVDFYTGLFGWSTEMWQGGPMPYTMWKNGDQTFGGVMPLPDEAKAAGAPQHWLSYYGSTDVDATAERIKELGGSILMGPMDMPEVGRMYTVTDPQGAVFCIYQPASDPPAQMGAPGIGAVSWHELGTTDYVAACDFYCDIFGWNKTKDMDMGEGGMYQMFGTDDRELGGMYTKPPDMPGPPAWLYYVSVEDVNASVKEVDKLGGKVMVGPMEVPGGDLVAMCCDPQGGWFAMHSLAAAK